MIQCSKAYTHLYRELCTHICHHQYYLGLQNLISSLSCI